MKQSILTYLQSLDRPAKKRELISMLRAKGIEAKERLVRLTIKELVTEGSAIGMSERGYFMVKTEAEHEAVKQYTKKKIFGLWKFYNEFDKAFCKSQPQKQPTLFSEMYG